MNRKRSISLLAALIVLQACAVRQPTTPKTPLQWTILYNAAMAKTNRAVEQTTEQLATSGTLHTDQARQIIQICGKVAAVSENIRTVTSSTQPWSQVAPQVQAALQQLGLTNLIAHAGITNSQLKDLLNALMSTVTLIQQEAH